MRLNNKKQFLPLKFENNDDLIKNTNNVQLTSANISPRTTQKITSFSLFEKQINDHNFTVNLRYQVYEI